MLNKSSFGYSDDAHADAGFDSLNYLGCASPGKLYIYITSNWDAPPNCSNPSPKKIVQSTSLNFATISRLVLHDFKT